MIELKKKVLKEHRFASRTQIPLSKNQFFCLLNMNLYNFQWGRCSILINYIISGMPLHSIWYWHTRLHGRCFLNWRFWIQWWVDLASCWWHTRWMGLGRVGILRTKTMKPQGKWWKIDIKCILFSIFSCFTSIFFSCRLFERLVTYE